MATESKANLVDLEKELTCSVSAIYRCSDGTTGLTITDMYRGAISTSHLDRLPALLLWSVLEGVVLGARKTRSGH